MWKVFFFFLFPPQYRDLESAWCTRCPLYPSPEKIVFPFPRLKWWACLLYSCISTPPQPNFKLVVAPLLLDSTVSSRQVLKTDGVLFFPVRLSCYASPAAIPPSPLWMPGFFFVYGQAKKSLMVFFLGPFDPVLLPLSLRT